MSNNPNEEFLPFSRPSISQAAIDEVVTCLKSGWITTGPRVKQFEEDLKAYLALRTYSPSPRPRRACTSCLLR